MSELAIAEWGAGQSDEVKKALGFEKGITPHQSTIAVSIVDHQTGIVVTQGHVEKGDTAPKSKQPAEETKRKPTDQKTESEQRDKQKGKKGKHAGKKSAQKEEEKEVEQEEKKQRSELAVAYRLIAHIDWKGKILTGDAFYCQRWLCAAILLAGGDYLFLVKANQPHLFEDLRLLVAPPPPAKRAGEAILRFPEQQGQSTDKGHGRLEIRSIRVSSELKGYSDWPGLDPRLPDPSSLAI